MNMLFWQNAAATWRHVEENVQDSVINWSGLIDATDTAIKQGNYLLEYYDNYSFDEIEDI